MSVRLLVGVPLALVALAPVFGVMGVPAAQAASGTYSCTSESWGGEALPTVTVQTPIGTNAAKGLARTEWRGQAKYATIVCTPM